MLKHIYDNQEKKWLRVQRLGAFYYIKNNPLRYSEKPFEEETKQEEKKEEITPKKTTRKRKTTKKKEEE